MSDYLGNLVTRSVGAVEGVRPRLAALFEPPRGTEGALSEVAEVTESAVAAADAPTFTDVAHERAPAAPTLARTPVVAPSHAPVAHARTATHAAGDAVGRAAPPHARSVPVASALPLALSQPAEQSPRRHVPVSAPLIPLDRSAPDRRREQRGATGDIARDIQRERLIERIVIERNVPPELRSAHAPAAPTAAERHDSRRPAIMAAAPVAPPASQATPPLIVRTELPTGLVARPLPAAITAQPRVSVSSEPTAPASAELPTEPTPVIQVTIGRIDVRATPTPAAPAQRPRATPPVMGLEDYLRQRAKRGSG
jgi:hypothetical protein